MKPLFGYLFEGVKSLGRFLFLYFVQLSRELWSKRDNIPTKELMTDVFSVLISTGMFGILNLIALFAFTLLPQGKDVFLIIAEEVGAQRRYGNLFFLLFGILLWSIVSEFGARYAIYVTDNSGKSISAERVAWRKGLQGFVADTFLMLPYLIVILGFLVNYLQYDAVSGDNKDAGFNKYTGFGIPALCVYLISNAVAQFYFDKRKRKQWREKDANSLLKFALLPKQELEWCNKLYGIYSNYSFTIRKPTNFNGQSYQRLLSWWQWLNNADDLLETFPKNSNEVNKDNRVPEAFELVKLDKESGRDDGQLRWIYKIPLNFYKTLHKQLLAVVFTCLIIFLIIALLPLSAYDNIGAPALLVLAFACYSGIYLGVLYTDYALLRNSKWSLRVLLVALLLFSSFFNDDHEVRYNEAGLFHDVRPGLKEHFVNWFNEYKKDSNTLYWIKGEPSSFYPVVFVCAEGGALRTGAYTSALLSFLQDSLAAHYNWIDFKKSIYAFSGVSGGSLGISFFNAMAYLTNKEDLKRNGSYAKLTNVFFNEDYLAPVIGKMFYGDVINWFWPCQAQKFDRAIALEEAWEDGFQKIINGRGQNSFSADYLNLYKSNHTYPAMFINTAEVETGTQCWLSNVKPDPSMLFCKERDLFGCKIKGGINYSTMTNFSSRFPLFSPAATIKENGSVKRHYVDGGYVENTGTGTMLEILKVLKPVMDSNCIRPFVLVLKYSQSNDADHSNISFANEASEILKGIYNTRSGRSDAALEELKCFVEKDTITRGKVSVLPLEPSGSEVPMNWVLSKRSLSKIQDDIALKWKNSNQNDLQKFFVLDGKCIPWRKWNW